MARSRSSLVCHILYKHGVWTGPCKSPDQYNPVPYHENSRIHQLVKRNSKKVYDTLKPAHIEDFKKWALQILEDQNYQSPWLVKADAFCWSLYTDFAPTYIKLYRNKEDILKSVLKAPFMIKHGYTEDRWREIIQAHQDEMDKVPGFKIDTDKMLIDFTELEAVIEHIGLKFDPVMTKEIIEHKGYQYC